MKNRYIRLDNVMKIFMIFCVSCGIYPINIYTVDSGSDASFTIDDDSGNNNPDSGVIITNDGGRGCQDGNHPYYICPPQAEWVICEFHGWLDGGVEFNDEPQGMGFCCGQPDGGIPLPDGGWGVTAWCGIGSHCCFDEGEYMGCCAMGTYCNVFNHKLTCDPQDCPGNCDQACDEGDCCIDNSQCQSQGKTCLFSPGADAGHCA